MLIQLLNYRLQPCRSYFVEVKDFREIFAKQVVGVLVGAALLRLMCRRKLKLYYQSRSYVGVQLKFPTAVRRYRMKRLRAQEFYQSRFDFKIAETTALVRLDGRHRQFVADWYFPAIEDIAFRSARLAAVTQMPYRAAFAR